MIKAARSELMTFYAHRFDGGGGRRTCKPCVLFADQWSVTTPASVPIPLQGKSVHLHPVRK